MEFLKTLGLFLATAFAEIIGCYLPYLWLKQGESIWLLLPAAASLALFVWLLSLHPTAAGRVYAAYGGVYIGVGIVWLWGGRKSSGHGRHHVGPPDRSLTRAATATAHGRDGGFESRVATTGCCPLPNFARVDLQFDSQLIFRLSSTDRTWPKWADWR